MATEKLKFKIELYSTMWDKPPHVEILINDDLQYKGDITETENKPNIIEFEYEMEEKEYSLVINRSGKGKNQTIVNENGDILKDQLLHIKNINIDEIDIGALVYEGVYTPKYPEPWATQQRESGNDLRDSFKNVTKMGFDGEWRFTFSSPFYMWLLENLY
tara:strand:+ start:1551 stop:2030 length:480 start_codon:yes stop_codon:yes gene_type:complete